MELVVAKVQRRVDGLEGLEVDVDLALFAFRGDDFTAVDNQAIGRHLGVEFQALLGGGDGRQDGETVDARLDVRGRALCVMVSGRWACMRVAGRHTNSSANILAAREIWSLGAVHGESGPRFRVWGLVWTRAAHTDDEGNHGCAISTGGFEALDQLFDFPDLDVLLGLVGLRLLGRHGRGGRGG